MTGNLSITLATPVAADGLIIEIMRGNDSVLSPFTYEDRNVVFCCGPLWRGDRQWAIPVILTAALPVGAPLSARVNKSRVVGV